MVDARGNTVTHGVYPGSGRGAVRPAKVCECTVLSYTGVLVVGGTIEAREGRKLPGLC